MARMSKLFRIEEEDFAELERIMPQLGDALMPVLNNKLRVQLARCKEILSDVRWGYGPAGEVQIIPGQPTNPTS
jgi:hypothetical protein